MARALQPIKCLGLRRRRGIYERWLHAMPWVSSTYFLTTNLVGVNWILTVINVKKLQFIHTVNGDGSKTAKIIKRQC